MIGAMIRQGPHHAAHISIRIGCAVSSRSFSKVASVRTTGPDGFARGDLHRPQTGCFAPEKEARFRVPQLVHFMISLDGTDIIAIISAKDLVCDAL